MAATARESFELFMSGQFNFSYFIRDNSTGVYKNSVIEKKFGEWECAYQAGYLSGVDNRPPDTRFGIADKVRPELMGKRINDWG